MDAESLRYTEYRNFARQNKRALYLWVDGGGAPRVCRAINVAYQGYRVLSSAQAISLALALAMIFLFAFVTSALAIGLWPSTPCITRPAITTRAG